MFSAGQRGQSSHCHLMDESIYFIRLYGMYIFLCILVGYLYFFATCYERLKTKKCYLCVCVAIFALLVSPIHLLQRLLKYIYSRGKKLLL